MVADRVCTLYASAQQVRGARDLEKSKSPVRSGHKGRLWEVADICLIQALTYTNAHIFLKDRSGETWTAFPGQAGWNGRGTSR